MYRVSAGITTNMSLSASDWIADNAKSLGLDGIWVGEDIGRGHDVFALTTAMILRARGVRVGTGIVPVTVHDIATLARVGRTMKELTEEEFIFGTGVGGIQDIRGLGIRLDRPVTALRESVETLRKLWAGETVTADCELFRLKDYSLGMKRPISIPIFLGVRGPQMLKLAGKIADGVMLSGPIQYLRYAIGVVRDEAVKEGRNPKSIEKVIWLPTIPTFKGMDTAVAKRVVALVVADTPDQVIDLAGVNKKQIELIRAAVSKNGPSEGAAYVTDDIMETFSVTGSSAHMVDEFDAIGKIGATEIVIGPPFSGDWRTALAEILHEIALRRKT